MAQHSYTPTMRQKKLITIACALGILACGACFLPPPGPPPYRPQTAPVRIDLRNSRRIRVQTANTSATHYIQARGLADNLVTAINYRDGGTPVRARAASMPRPTDAVLQVTVIEESIEPSPNGQKSLSYRITVDATLAAPDGAIIWRADRRPCVVSPPVPVTDEDQMWSYRSDHLPWSLAQALVKQMFDGT